MEVSQNQNMIAKLLHRPNPYPSCAQLWNSDTNRNALMLEDVGLCPGNRANNSQNKAIHINTTENYRHVLNCLQSPGQKHGRYNSQVPTRMTHIPKKNGHLPPMFEAVPGQVSRDVSIATPRLIQWASSTSLMILIGITKFVEWPGRQSPHRGTAKTIKNTFRWHGMSGKPGQCGRTSVHAYAYVILDAYNILYIQHVIYIYKNTILYYMFNII